MNRSFKVKDKMVDIYYKDNSKEKELPVVIYNAVQNEGEEIFEECLKQNCKDFVFVVISNIDWNNDMSPWKIDKISKNDIACTGGADEYLKTLTNDIIPKIKNNLDKKIKEFILTGYSLAGLFAIYSLYKTDIFHKIVTCSGSLWYPNIVEFISEEKMLNKPSKIYFSLGNTEKKTKNKILSCVEDNTKYIEKYYRNMGIETIYEENEGNHFQEASLRVAKGIKWILK